MCAVVKPKRHTVSKAKPPVGVLYLYDVGYCIYDDFPLKGGGTTNGLPLKLIVLSVLDP